MTELEESPTEAVDYDITPLLQPLQVRGLRLRNRFVMPGMQRYLTVYELDSPDVMKSAEWDKAGSYGDWAAKIRPLLTSRHHSVFERIA